MHRISALTYSWHYATLLLCMADVGKSSLEAIKNYFLTKQPRAKVVYLFGSRARGEAGPISDYDFAILADTRDTLTLGDMEMSINGNLQRLIGSNNVDVVMLNLLDKPELKFAIYQDGIRLLSLDEDMRVAFEVQTMNEYFDFQAGLEYFGLTKGIHGRKN